MLKHFKLLFFFNKKKLYI